MHSSSREDVDRRKTAFREAVRKAMEAGASHQESVEAGYEAIRASEAEVALRNKKGV